MVRGRKRCVTFGLRHSVVAVGVVLWLALSVGAHAASLLPPSFFDRVPETQTGQAGVEADELLFDSETNIITAHGNVGLSYTGYYSTSDHMTFNQTTRDLELTGNVVIVDPDGTQYNADHAVLTGGFKNAVLNSMVMLTNQGAMVTSDKTTKIRGESTVLKNATYAPCGTCIDSKGRKIGWRFRASRLEQNTKEGYIDAENPILEILGVPIAWAPWLRLPSADIPDGFGGPTYAYGAKVGWKVSVPYYTSLGEGVSVILTPSLISQQGLLLGAKATHTVGNWGSYSVTGHGMYQLDPSKFNAGFGDENLRGSIQTSGKFTPVENWNVGWSYTTFTDTAFLTNYLIPTANPVTNEVFAEYLTKDTFAEVRVQEFVLLGEIAKATQDRQARALPTARFDHLQDLGSENGEVRIKGEVLGVDRTADHTKSNGVPFVVGYAGQKLHGYAEAVWSKQFIMGGAALTPYAGIRADAASYNGGSALNPTASTLFTATPFAALDLRYPFMATDGGSTHIIEPIAQIVYRASNVTNTGITNDNAQSFVLDDSNVFSFNRFSGSDRQETGLRANIGGHYLANFEDGSYLDFVVGQSFHLAGLNALSASDAAKAGAGAGLSGNSSDVVAGVRGSTGGFLTFGVKGALDVGMGSISKFAADATVRHAGWSLGLDYAYFGADSERGYTADQQDLGGTLSGPLADYWTATARAGWNLTTNQLINYGVGVTYDDGFVVMKLDVTSSGPLIYDPVATTYKLTFKLRGLDGTEFGAGFSPKSLFSK